MSSSFRLSHDSPVLLGMALLLVLLLNGFCPPRAAAETPKLLAPAAEAGDVNIPVTLHWQSITGVNEYECDVARDAKFTDSVPIRKKVTGDTLVLTHLLPGVRYYWHIRGGSTVPWSMTQAFTTSENLPLTARDGRVVLCANMENGGQQIYIQNADGSGLTQLTQVKMPSQPAFSSDGRLVAFTMGDGGLFGNGGLYLMNADGSGCHRLPLAPGRVGSPNFSARGDVIFFLLSEQKGEENHLCSIHIDGTGFQRLAPLPFTFDFAYSDVNALFAISQHTLVLYSATEFKKILALPNPENLQNEAPCFNRDGRTVASYAHGTGVMKLMLSGTDGSGEVCLATGEELIDPCFSPDSSTLLFSDHPNLHFITIDGGPGRSYPNPVGLRVMNGMSWQAGAGRWSPEPPAQVAPVDKLTGQALPVRLSWSPRLGVTGYALQVSTDALCQQPVFTQSPVFGNALLVKALKPQTQYYWRIRCLFREEAGPWSPVHSFKTGVAATETDFGMVHGSASYDAGGPIASVRVTITIGQQSSTIVAGEDGVFEARVPVGSGTVSIDGAKMPVVVSKGRITKVKLVKTPATGIVLTIKCADGTPRNGVITAASRLPAALAKNRDPETIYMNPCRIGPGVYWLPDVKAEIAEFAANTSMPGSCMHGLFFQRWTFTKPETLRRLTMTVPMPVHVQITMVDEKGTPLANTLIDGQIACWSPDVFRFWSTSRKGNYVSVPLKNVVTSLNTDAQGRIDFQNLPPGDYNLILGSDVAVGNTVTLTVTEDKTFTPKTYTLRRSRQVTQRVYRLDGQPAAKTVGYASFTQAGHVIIRRMTTDASGTVIWSNLPHTRVIVSGTGVAPGVIQTEGISFTQQLPAPTPGRTGNFHLAPRMTGTESFSFGMVMSAPGHREFRLESVTVRSSMDGGSMNENWSMPTGAPCSLFLGVSGTPVKAHLLTAAYLPYLDDVVEQIELPVNEMPFTDYTGIPITGKIMTKAGTPLLKGTTIAIVPAGSNPLHEPLSAWKTNWLLVPKIATDGTFTASLPPTGLYEVHLLDSKGESNIVSTFNVTVEKTPGAIIVTIP